MNKIYFEDIVIEHIVKPSLKNSSITIKSFDEILLKTPKVSKQYIENLLQKKYKWIQKQRTKLQLHKPKKVNLEDEVLIFGEIYSIDSQEAIILREKLQKLQSYTQKNILKCYDDFYKEYAKMYLPSLMEKYVTLMQLNYSEIKFRKMKRRWGSCSSKKVITLNTKLMQIQKELIPYVIVHELAHLVHMNHSKKFHLLVESHLPNAKQLRQKLKTTYLDD